MFRRRVHMMDQRERVYLVAQDTLRLVACHAAWFRSWPGERSWKVRLSPCVSLRCQRTRWRKGAQQLAAAASSAAAAARMSAAQGSFTWKEWMNTFKKKKKGRKKKILLNDDLWALPPAPSTSPPSPGPGCRSRMQRASLRSQPIRAQRGTTGWRTAANHRAQQVHWADHFHTMFNWKTSASQLINVPINI